MHKEKLYILWKFPKFGIPFQVQLINFSEDNKILEYTMTHGICFSSTRIKTDSNVALQTRNSKNIFWPQWAVNHAKKLQNIKRLKIALSYYIKDLLFILFMCIKSIPISLGRDCPSFLIFAKSFNIPTTNIMHSTARLKQPISVQGI